MSEQHHREKRIAGGGPLVLDRLARTKINLAGVHLPSFQVCGYTGVVLAIALAMSLVHETGLSYWTMGLLAITAMATFLVLAFLTKIITGTEQLIYYHHEIAIALMTALVCRILHQPVLRYLDLTILGVGVFLACGRIGCLMVGCCHGRPCAWGICYREEHAREGFAPYLVGMRLFPIQAVESLWVLVVVIVAARFVLAGSPPGTALAWYTVAYGTARFLFEFVRGDTDRPYTWGFSQGQWLSLWLMTGLVGTEFSGRLVFHGWHVVVASALPLIMVLTTVWRRVDQAQRFLLVHPQHIREIAGAIRSLEASCSQPPPVFSGISIASTSMGLQISAGNTRRMGTVISHFTISCRNRRLTRQAAQIVADVIQQLGRISTQRELVSGEEGVFHMLLPGAQNGGAA